ncbi:MAG TPA: hypothetical protein VJL80_14475 [Aeromicrobium sp.]|nr:hypothetical protein [Aeromicrobium sp.]HKY59239.1 hypothetical protein [Aeromicrobium sp.]
MSPAAWATWLTVAGVLIVAGVYRIRKYGRAEGGDVTPLDDLLGDDTLAMVAEDRPAAEMWDSFEEADVHGIEVDDTAAEADMVSLKGTFLTPDGQQVGATIWAHGPAVIAQEKALFEAIDAWMTDLDVKAWLGERGWL